MKGLVLSGGRGTRLRPITHTSAKQLVPVANKPILFYCLEDLRDAGVADVGIVVGETYRDIMQAVGDGSAWNLRVTYVHQPEPLGLAHAIKVARDYLQDEEFVMYLGDNLVLGGVRSLVEEFAREKPNCQILLARVPDARQFGVAVVENGRVVNLEEKPKQPKSDLALVGVYMFDRNVHEAVNSISPSWRSELEITDAIQYLVTHGFEVRPHLVSGWWKDTGKLEDLLEANRMVLDTLQPQVLGEVRESRVEGRVSIGEGTVVEHSLLRGPAIIGAKCTITHAYVGPYTSIADNTTLSRAEIEHSIVLADCVIREVSTRIADSLLGREAAIVGVGGRPATHCFMLGDHSTVRLA